MCDDLRSEAKRRIVALQLQFLLLGLFGHVYAIGRAKRVTSRIRFARAPGKSERRQDLQKQVIIIRNMYMLSSGKPRVALRMILRVYRSVFASTLVLTAISTVIAIALCAVTHTWRLGSPSPGSPPDRPDLRGERDNRHEASTTHHLLSFLVVINMRNGLQSDGQETSLDSCGC